MITKKTETKTASKITDKKIIDILKAIYKKESLDETFLTYEYKNEENFKGKTTCFVLSWELDNTDKTDLLHYNVVLRVLSEASKYQETEKKAFELLKTIQVHDIKNYENISNFSISSIKKNFALNSIYDLNLSIITSNFL